MKRLWWFPLVAVLIGSVVGGVVAVLFSGFTEARYLSVVELQTDDPKYIPAVGTEQAVEVVANLDLATRWAVEPSVAAERLLKCVSVVTGESGRFRIEVRTPHASDSKAIAAGLADQLLHPRAGDLRKRAEELRQKRQSADEEVGFRKALAFRSGRRFSTEAIEVPEAPDIASGIPTDTDASVPSAGASVLGLVDLRPQAPTGEDEAVSSRVHLEVERGDSPEPTGDAMAMNRYLEACEARAVAARDYEQALQRVAAEESVLRPENLRLVSEPQAPVQPDTPDLDMAEGVGRWSGGVGALAFSLLLVRRLEKRAGNGPAPACDY